MSRYQTASGVETMLATGGRVAWGDKVPIPAMAATLLTITAITMVAGSTPAGRHPRGFQELTGNYLPVGDAMHPDRPTEYTDRWAVVIAPGPHSPNQIAAQHNFENIGQVGAPVPRFLFLLPIACTLGGGAGGRKIPANLAPLCDIPPARCKQTIPVLGLCKLFHKFPPCAPTPLRAAQPKGAIAPPPPAGAACTTLPSCIRRYQPYTCGFLACYAKRAAFA